LEAHAREHAAGGAHEGHHGSIWPLVIALAGAFGFGGLAVQFWPSVLAGVVLLAVGLGGWLRQDSRGVSFALTGVFHEHPFGREITPRKLGIWIFIVSEIFFFTGLISAGLALRTNANFWPDPASPDFPLNIPLTAVNTFILIASSFTMAEAVHAAFHDKPAHMKAFLAATLVLGATFVSIQVYEYVRLFDSAADGALCGPTESQHLGSVRAGDAATIAARVESELRRYGVVVDEKKMGHVSRSCDAVVSSPAFGTGHATCVPAAV